MKDSLPLGQSNPESSRPRTASSPAAPSHDIVSALPSVETNLAERSASVIPRAILPPPVDPPTVVGRLGPYDVVDEIGAGGMALVYKAVQPSLGRLVAIKVLRPEYMHDRQIATRFEREAAALATLQHGNIVHVYDFARQADRAYIVMEYVEGVDLYDLLAEAKRLPADVAALVARGVSEGLEHAHSRGIIHRDIKPSNIIVSKKGEIKIMDFGIARDPGKSDLTRAGLAVGTPAYMAPEQIRGDTIDFRTDMFAVGIVLYEMLAGSKPWVEEEGRSITIKVLDEPMRPLLAVAPDVPPALLSIVERCLNKRPDQRFASTHQLTVALDEFIQRGVTVEPRSRLLIFLSNRGYISQAEAASSVTADQLAGAAVRRRDVGIPLPPMGLLLRPVIMAHAVVLALVLLMYVLSSVTGAEYRRPTPTLTLLPTLPSAARPMGAASAVEPMPNAVASAGLEEPAGWLRVVAHPWARVFIDTEYIDTTPFARSIRLTPGRHRVGFRNPYFESQDRFVEIVAGKTGVLKVALPPLEDEAP